MKEAELSINNKTIKQRLSGEINFKTELNVCFKFSSGINILELGINNCLKWFNSDFRIKLEKLTENKILLDFTKITLESSMIFSEINSYNYFISEIETVDIFDIKKKHNSLEIFYIISKREKYKKIYFILKPMYDILSYREYLFVEINKLKLDFIKTSGLKLNKKIKLFDELKKIDKKEENIIVGINCVFVPQLKIFKKNNENENVFFSFDIIPPEALFLTK